MFFGQWGAARQQRASSDGPKVKRAERALGKFLREICRPNILFGGEPFMTWNRYAMVAVAAFVLNSPQRGLSQSRQEQRQASAEEYLFQNIDPAQLSQFPPDVQKRYREWSAKRRDAENQRREWAADDAVQQFLANAAALDIKALRQFVANKPEMVLSSQYPLVERYIKMREDQEGPASLANKSSPVANSPASEDAAQIVATPAANQTATQAVNGHMATSGRANQDVEGAAKNGLLINPREDLGQFVPDGVSLIKPLKRLLDIQAGKSPEPISRLESMELWYVIGLLDGIPAVMTHPLGQDDLVLHIPQDTSREKLGELVYAYLLKHPESHGELPQIAVMLAVRDAFPSIRVPVGQPKP